MPSTAETSDAHLAELLDRLLAQSRGGRMPDLEGLIREQPQLEREIRELWATMMLAEDFASFSGDLDLHTVISNRNGDQCVAGSAVPRDFGDYELIDEIGRGGMGVVYRARQKSLNRIVALKMILRGDTASDTELARFRAEAESAAKVVHPHIVPVYEVGEREGQPYFSMKLIEGTTLSKRLLDGPLPSRQAAELLVPICRAIADAHRQGVLHRDLKPSNILIDFAGRTFVTDFGLAKRLTVDGEGSLSGSLTHSGAILGTPGYMAPEQAAGKRGEVSPATDVYSLGAILYATITGRPPFQAPSAFDTVMMVLEQDPLPPRMLNPKADPDLEMIALKCLQKPADLRYADADALANDLEAYLASEPIAARSSQLTQILSRAFRETHHAAVLENWGLLWMWHSLVVLVLCVTTNAIHRQGVQSRWLYVALWSGGVGLWAFIFWELRKRAGPITFVERQIAHVWAGSTISSTLLYGLEWMLDLPVLTLSPVLGLIAGSVFVVKAGILSGKFYITAAGMYVTTFLMALLQRNPAWDFGLTLYGVAVGLGFFLPGWKYWRQRADAAQR